jgi:hypothetical protein
MNFTKIKKFIKFINSFKTNMIYLDSHFKLSKEMKPNNPINISKNEIFISISNYIYLIINKLTFKIACIFSNSLEYIQTEYYLFSLEKYTTKYIKYIINNIPILNLSNCLVIGLCLGNYPNLLISKYDSIISRIDCVDVNSELCKLYKKFLTVSNKIHVYNTSANEFVLTNKIKYSLVLIDIPCKYVTYKLLNLIDKITIKPRCIQLNLIGDEYKKINIDKLLSKFKIISYKLVEENNIYIIE